MAAPHCQWSVVLAPESQPHKHQWSVALRPQELSTRPRQPGARAPSGVGALGWRAAAARRSWDAVGSQTAAVNACSGAGGGAGPGRRGLPEQGRPEPVLKVTGPARGEQWALGETTGPLQGCPTGWQGWDRLHVT